MENGNFSQIWKSALIVQCGQVIFYYVSGDLALWIYIRKSQSFKNIEILPKLGKISMTIRYYNKWIQNC